MKKCSRCNEIKDKSEFVKHRGRKDGLYTYCKVCHQERKRENKYKLSKEEIIKLYKDHDSRCAICNVEEGEKKLAIDHCHNIGKVRGLLCSNCNTAIGLLKDDTQLLNNAIEYLNLGKFYGND